jgi:hypothetical protein
MSFDTKDCESDTDLGSANKDSGDSWNEGRLSVKSVTPSVIRRGLCMVRDEGNNKFDKHK